MQGQGPAPERGDVPTTACAPMRCAAARARAARAPPPPSWPPGPHLGPERLHAVGRDRIVNGALHGGAILPRLHGAALKRILRDQPVVLGAWRRVLPLPHSVQQQLVNVHKHVPISLHVRAC